MSENEDEQGENNRGGKDGKADEEEKKDRGEPDKGNK